MRGEEFLCWQKACVRVGNEVSEWFPARLG